MVVVYASTSNVTNLPSILSRPSKKSTKMPYVETVKHDLNNAANEMVAYSALYFLINSFGLEKYIYQADDTALIDTLKSAGIVVTLNEALRLAKRMGWSVNILK